MTSSPRTTDPDAQTAASVAEVEVKTERDVNMLTNEPVLRVFARRVGERRWRKFLAVPGAGETIAHFEEHAQEIGETWLRLEESRG